MSLLFVWHRRFESCVTPPRMTDWIIRSSRTIIRRLKTDKHLDRLRFPSLGGGIILLQFYDTKMHCEIVVCDDDTQKRNKDNR